MGGLAGFTVAITADRRRHEQARLLERAGFEVALFPLLRTEAADENQLRSLTEDICRCPPQYLVANTGYGMREWFAGAAEWGLLEDLTEALRAKTRIAARGAKALGELRKAGLDAFYKAPGETLAEVVEQLLREGVAGKDIAVQLHGEVPGEELGSLERAGARLAWLGVYQMTSAGDQAGQAAALAQAITSGSLNAVTFTAAPQVQALFACASPLELLAGFNTSVVAACIGPVCAGAARAVGIASPLVPPHPRLGSLVAALAAHFAAKTGVGTGD